MSYHHDPDLHNVGNYIALGSIMSYVHEQRWRYITCSCNSNSVWTCFYLPIDIFTLCILCKPFVYCCIFFFYNVKRERCFSVYFIDFLGKMCVDKM